MCTQKKKLIFSILNFGFGGAERTLINLANTAVKNNYNVIILTYYNSPAKYLLNEKVTVKSCNCSRKNKILTFFQSIIRTKRFLLDQKPDCVISFLTQTNIIHLIVKIFVRTKLIIAIRNDPNNVPKQPLYRVLRFFLYRFSNGFVFQTKAAKNFFSKTIQHKSAVIHNPVFIRKANYGVSKRCSKIIVNVGRLTLQKNQKLLIKAFSNIYHEFPSYKLHIYGEGDLEFELRQYISDLKLNDCVKLLGTRSGIEKHISNASMLVITSDYEGMPNVLMEAMALGIPTISSDCPIGGPAELIVHGKNGLLFQPNDLLELVRCMRKLITNPNFAYKIALNGKKIVDTHSPEIIFLKWERYIKNVCLG